MAAAHKPGARLYEQYGEMPRLPISHGVGDDRHIVVSCRCGRTAIWDAPFVFVRGIGGQRIEDVQRRLVCTCGARGATIAIFAGPAPTAAVAAAE